MPTKILNSKISNLKNKQTSSQKDINFSKSHVFGMPSKPRYLEPSMFEILSWGANDTFVNESNFAN